MNTKTIVLSPSTPICHWHTIGNARPIDMDIILWEYQGFWRYTGTAEIEQDLFNPVLVIHDRLCRQYPVGERERIGDGIDWFLELNRDSGRRTGKFEAAIMLLEFIEQNATLF